MAVSDPVYFVLKSMLILSRSIQINLQPCRKLGGNLSNSPVNDSQLFLHIFWRGVSLRLLPKFTFLGFKPADSLNS
jgi:hypothetical protein